jgi:talin
MLVNSATAAQKERIEKGRVSNNSSLYKRDPTWSQGLISAAKAVAQATAMLVSTANDAVAGKVDEESLIAASKAVASSTAQLVAATRAKSDPNSPTQIKLGLAAKAVTDATSYVVELYLRL